MIRRPPRSTLTYTLFPSTTLCRSPDGSASNNAASDRQSTTCTAAGTPGVQSMPCDNSLADGRGATLRAFAGTLARGDRARVAAYVLVSLLAAFAGSLAALFLRSEEHTSELQLLMRISSAVFCLNKKRITN